MTIDLDELERQVTAYAWENPSRDGMLELIALARKGQTASAWAERAVMNGNRAEVYERALRGLSMRGCEYPPVRHGYSTCGHNGVKCCPCIAREALEKGAK